MPKRKSEDEYKYFKRKIKKLEKKLRHRRRLRSPSSDSRSSSPEIQQRSVSDVQDVEDINELIEDEENSMCNELPSNKLASVVVRQQSAAIHYPETCDFAPPSSPPPPPPLESDHVLPPAASALPTADPSPSILDPAAVLETEKLSSDLLEILGSDPTSVKTYGKDIQKDLSIRLEHHTTSGLSKELRKELNERYLTPDNCKLIDPPVLNAEIKAAVSDLVIKRDKAIENKQRHLSTAITCVGEAITDLLSSKEKHTNLLKPLMDAVRIMCDCQHADSLTRRNFLLNSVKKDMKEQLQNTKIDRFLFGNNLSDTLKSAKAIVRSGADLKQPAPKPQNKRTTPNSFPKNWKGQVQSRRPPIPPRMKEPATTTTRGRPNFSSKQSHHPQPRAAYNRR